LEHYTRRKNTDMTKIEFYGLPGRKCPLCPCFFATSIDYEAHMKTHWRKSSSGKGEWLPAEADPTLARMLNIVGAMIKEGYRYTLIDNKIIYRTKAQY